MASPSSRPSCQLKNDDLICFLAAAQDELALKCVTIIYQHLAFVVVVVVVVIILKLRNFARVYRFLRRATFSVSSHHLAAAHLMAAAAAAVSRKHYAPKDDGFAALALCTMFGRDLRLDTNKDTHGSRIEWKFSNHLLIYVCALVNARCGRAHELPG